MKKNIDKKVSVNIEMYKKIYKRACELDCVYEDEESFVMDLSSADCKFDLDLDKLLNADNFNFAHDIGGIQANIVRDCWPSEKFNGFVPRCAK